MRWAQSRGSSGSFRGNPQVPPPPAEGADGQDPLGWPGGEGAGEEGWAPTRPDPQGQFCPQVTLTGRPASRKNHSWL